MQQGVVETWAYIHCLTDLCTAEAAVALVVVAVAANDTARAQTSDALVLEEKFDAVYYRGPKYLLIPFWGSLL